MGLENGIDICDRKNPYNVNLDEDYGVIWCSFRSLRRDIIEILIKNHKCSKSDIDAKIVELSIQDVKDIKSAVSKYIRRRYFNNYADCSGTYDEMVEKLFHDTKILEEIIQKMENNEIPPDKMVCFYDSY